MSWHQDGVPSQVTTSQRYSYPHRISGRPCLFFLLGLQLLGLAYMSFRQLLAFKPQAHTCPKSGPEHSPSLAFACQRACAKSQALQPSDLTSIWWQQNHLFPVNPLTFLTGRSPPHKRTGSVRFLAIFSSEPWDSPVTSPG